MNTRNKIYVLAAVILVLFIAQGFCHNWIDGFSEKKEIIQINPFKTLPPTEYLSEYLSTIILGGFKPFIINGLWLKADKLREERQYYEVRALLELIARLQPRCIQVWTFNAWNMAYNISRQEVDPFLRWRWVKEGLSYLEDGYQRNPRSHKLTSEIAFIAYHRIPQESVLMEWCEKKEGMSCYELAAKWYKHSVSLTDDKWKKYDYHVMWRSCRWLQAFELLKDGKVDAAITELENLSDFTRDNLAATHKNLARRWLTEAQNLLEVKAIFSQEKLLLDYQTNKESDKYWSQLALVLNQYRSLIHAKTSLDFNPLNKRVELLLLEYLKMCYGLMDQGKYTEALNEIQMLEKSSQVLIQHGHPTQWFYDALYQRFNKLVLVIEAEASALEKYQAQDPEAVEYIDKILGLYRIYLKEGADFGRFNLNYETRRVEYLKQLIK